MTLLSYEFQSGWMEALGEINRNAGAVLEGRANPPEVIEMLVADDQRLNLALLQQPVNTLLGEAAVHPFGAPARIE